MSTDHHAEAAIARAIIAALSPLAERMYPNGDPLTEKTDGPESAATEEPAVGEQVTDSDGDVWQRFEDGWYWWKGESGCWSSIPRARDYVQTTYGPLGRTTDDDRRRVGLPVRNEDASPETYSDVLAGLADHIHFSSPDGREVTVVVPAVPRGYLPLRPLQAIDLCGHPMPCWVEGCLKPEGARSLSEQEVLDLIHRPQESKAPAPEPTSAPLAASDATEASGEGEVAAGRETGAQGRIGWLRVEPDDELRCLVREIPGGWAETDIADDLAWAADDFPDAEFTPIRALAADEVAVKRDDLRAAVNGLAMEGLDWALVRRLYDALNAGEDRG